MSSYGQTQGALGSAMPTTNFAQANQMNQNSAILAGSVAPPPSGPPSFPDMLAAAANAVSRLQEVADSAEAIGDKLAGSVPTSGKGEASGSASGSMGQLAGYLSIIHATISRIERGVGRLHEIHG